ncbi:IclR family transcriptional regulator [Rhodococcus fascians]|uniref:IclR family transcriptional regulator n=1 Tax=Rhodococcoides fascians TaxID=1828 RepID=UPI00195617BB|nr:IclR family transcriptional regulator [Rhodococcus fascians]MDP9637864.1 DNA-binding IclR family transcriptional regulator [Rhodococcus cercidiphylli]MBY3790892.1 IclR family transcriptional regulator [Rhodococcus fascians]MBY3823588.1 IclR family transcriptional regulator [Rhodococcus fascians]MBY3834110.1 IclR family transcriptional regulator [Rhodococcus fascians]MBY3863323.1 IclR family transcriptional regulator [Rhodococcus fascians]
MAVPTESDAQAGRDIVGAVVKACALLDHFDTTHPVWTLNDLTTASRMNKTTVHRLMTTLIHAGWVDRTAEGSYRIAMPVFEIGSSALTQLDIRGAAQPYLSDIAQKFGDTAYLMVPADEGAVCIDRHEGSNPLVVAGISIGSVLPYHATAGPMAMLAFSARIRDRWLGGELAAYTSRTLTSSDQLMDHLDRIRTQGYALSNSDYLAGVAAVGAPILGRDGVVVASISVGGRVETFEGDALADKVETILAAARSLSRVAEALPATSQ